MTERVYRVRRTRAKDRGYYTEYVGTLAQLKETFGYELFVGKQYEREKGNKRINMYPGSVRSLVTNLNNAANNAAADGYSGVLFELIEEVKE